MDPELLRRVRWGNLARAAAVLAIVAAVIAWPRLGPPEPDLPPGGVEPAEVVTDVPSAADATAPAPARADAARREGRRGRYAAGRRASSRGVARSGVARRSRPGRGRPARCDGSRHHAARPHGPRRVAQRRLPDAPPEPLDVPEVAAAPAPTYRQPLPEFGAE